MSFNTCHILDYEEFLHGEVKIPGGPRITCSCGQSVQASFYAQHVANQVVTGLVERCEKAEVRLTTAAHESQREDDARGVMNNPETARLNGKRSGVALVRSYIEEVRRGG